MIGKPGDAVCRPEDVDFHLKYVSTSFNGKDHKDRVKRGGIILNYGEMESLVNSTTLQMFVRRIHPGDETMLKHFDRVKKTTPSPNSDKYGDWYCTDLVNRREWIRSLKSRKLGRERAARHVTDEEEFGGENE